MQQIFEMVWQTLKCIIFDNVKKARGVILPTDIFQYLYNNSLIYLNFPEFILFFSLKVKKRCTDIN